MPLLRPRMALEPPPEYVAFVGQHLAELRADTTRVVGDPHDANLLYPDVLTEVAVRWRWLELLRTRLGRPWAADRYLRRAFLRLAQRWQNEQLWPAELPSDIRVEIEVWHPDRPPPPRRSSAATRLAPQLRPAVELEIGPVAEAAVAWWHAYEAHRRRRYYLLLVVLLLGFAALARFVQAGGGG